MGVRKTKLPSVPVPTPDNHLDVLNALKEIVEVGIRDIDRGDTLDAYVTFRDIRDGNTGLDHNLEGAIIGAPANPGGPRPPPGGPFPPGVDPGDNYLPGRPTNVRTQAVWDGIMVLWDWPDQGDPNITWDRAAVHSSATTLFDDGNIVGYSATDVFVHSNIGFSDPTGDPDEVSPGVRYYWVRFEWNNPTTGELEVTEWSPYEYQDGVRGETATDIDFFIETFRLASSEHPEYGSIAPFIVGEIDSLNEDGEPITTLAIGLDGHFLVNGTITAKAIQAGTIGAREIYAQSIWAGLMTANNIITSTFTTRPYPDWRLEINGEGTTYESFPLWYGREETGGDGGLFWIQRYLTKDDEGNSLYTSSMFLSGELYVTGIGKFFAGNVLFDEDGHGEPDYRAMRIEIGGPNTDFLVWAGSGLTGVGDIPHEEDPTLDSKPVFFIDNMGNAVFRGTVEAEFVSGEISRTAIIYHDGPRQVPKPPGGKLGKGDISTWEERFWLELGVWELPEPPFDTGHIPYADIGFLMYGDGEKAGSTRLEYKITVEGAWIPVHYTVHDIAQYGGSRNVSAVLPFERRDGKTWFRFSAAGFDGHRPTVNSLRGLLMGIR